MVLIGERIIVSLSPIIKKCSVEIQRSLLQMSLVTACVPVSCATCSMLYASSCSALRSSAGCSIMKGQPRPTRKRAIQLRSLMEAERMMPCCALSRVASPGGTLRLASSSEVSSSTSTSQVSGMAVKDWMMYSRMGKSAGGENVSARSSTCCTRSSRKTRVCSRKWQ